MRWRVKDVLLVSSLYDLYLFEEDGRLYELIHNEYQGLHLSLPPEMTRVSKGEEALRLLQEEHRFELILCTLHIEDMHALKFAKLLHEKNINVPIVLLVYDSRELKDLLTHHDTSHFERIFLWQGNFRLIIAIIKHLEDKRNVEQDSSTVGVQSIILIEDNIQYYSSFLPLIYSEIAEQSQRLISEGVNLSHKYLRMRARPKILLCTTYEEAWEYFTRYEENILGVISDIDFSRNGMQDAKAGIEFAKNVKKLYHDIPIILQSTSRTYETEAMSIGASFLLKNSPTLLLELRQLMNQYFSFGDFVFRTQEGLEVGTASDLKSLEEQLAFIPDESLLYHVARNHFSRWLKARTEFALAYKLRPRKISDYTSIRALREDIIASLKNYRQTQQRGLIADFSKETFDPTNSFARIGGGSLGGKARGLGFINMLINEFDIQKQFDGVQIFVPPSIVIGTDVFDGFLDRNNLRDFALNAIDDEEIVRRFVETEYFPEEILLQLTSFLQLINAPLAVRSSSLLEDSQYHPFAGVYGTYMIPNNNTNLQTRLEELVFTIKKVYASTFFQSAKEYIKMTSYRTEEEKMAVIVQKLIGAQHGSRFYPDISGVAKSYNFYPVAPQKPFDGIVSAALGLGKTIVEGGVTVRFCPKYPTHLLQFHSTEETLRNSQKKFYALEMNESPLQSRTKEDTLLKKYPLEIAERDGTLKFVGSTYSPDNDAIYDGLSKIGIRLTTFAPVLRHKIFPLAGISEILLQIGSGGMGTPVEIEVAANLSGGEKKQKEFGVLQMRPLVLGKEFEELNVENVSRELLICESSQVLGNGILDSIRDVVLVNIHKFDRAKSREVATEVSSFNEQLIAEQRPYLLIGVGRWGSLDPWLGIPLKWNQISGAKAIIETSFKDFDVAPSQGSHFFQNITSFMIGYFTVNPNDKNDFINWEWLLSQEVVEEKTFTRHLRFSQPLLVKMNGHKNKGIILKPV
ncbi:MAG: histidine kinase [Ignavibacteriales bacterium]|nr:histidine kinase [Ignavibacteriales bacterium]